MCQELAVRNCGVANVLDQAAVEPGGNTKRGGGCAGGARALALLYAAEEARNRATGDALDLYYKLVAAETGVQVGRGAEADLNSLLKAVRAAVAAGLKEPPDVPQLETQLADVSAEVIRADGGAREINHGLKALLGLPSDPHDRLWPDPPEVARVPDNVDETVRVGLTCRPDLLILRALLASGDSEAPQLARQALGGVNPLLAGSLSVAPSSAGTLPRVAAACLGLAVPSPEQNNHTRKQVATLLAARTTS